MTEAAEEWIALNKDSGALYRGLRLAQAQLWAKEHANALNELEQEFLRASEERVAAEVKEKSRIQREREEA